MNHQFVNAGDKIVVGDSDLSGEETIVLDGALDNCVD